MAGGSHGVKKFNKRFLRVGREQIVTLIYDSNVCVIPLNDPARGRRPYTELLWDCIFRARCGGASMSETRSFLLCRSLFVGPGRLGLAREWL